MRIAKLFGVVTAFAAVMVTFVSPAEAATVIKIATTAPSTSTWGNALKTWATAVETKSGGSIQLQIVANGTTGDEAAMVAAMNAGTIHGAILTGAGLGKIFKPIGLLQMPGVFSSWAKFDSTREAFAAEFDQGLSTAGFVNLGWFDSGTRRPFARDFALHVPSDFSGQLHCAYEPSDDDVTTTFFRAVTGVRSGPTVFSAVLPAFFANGPSPGLLATSLESERNLWSSHYADATDLAAAYEVGAFVLSNKHLPVIPATTKTIVSDAGRAAAADFAKHARADDDAAWLRIKGKVTVTTPTAADLLKWQTVFKDTRAMLPQLGYSAAEISKIETMGK